MNEFRNRIPKRRSNPKAVSKYGDYKDDLREDFNRRCGYCDDEDSYDGKRFFQIDQFAPRKYLKTISEKEYSNLTYSCFFCNNAKRADWPTKDENVHNNGQKGYIDACNPEYDRQFARDSFGEILARTEIGKYMHKKLKLFLQRHSVMWSLSRIRSQIFEIKELLTNEENSEIKEKLDGLHQKYFDYCEQLRMCNEE